MKKGLLILFGQWRQFESIYHQMKDEYAHFDIIVSTWDNDYGLTEPISKPVTRDRVRKLFPHAKTILIHKENSYNEQGEPVLKNNFLKYHFSQFNTHKMVHHWKSTLPFIDDSYEKVVLQRFDLLCNTSKILEEDIQEGKIYIDWSWFGDDYTAPFAQDWLFVGTSGSMKKWISLFPSKYEMMSELADTPYEQGPLAHISIGIYMKKYGIDDVLNLTSELKKIWYKLIKRVPIDGKIPNDIMDDLNKQDIVFLNLDRRSNLFKKVLSKIEEYPSPWRQYGNRRYLDSVY